MYSRNRRKSQRAFVGTSETKTLLALVGNSGQFSKRASANLDLSWGRTNHTPFVEPPPGTGGRRRGGSQSASCGAVAVAARETSDSLQPFPSIPPGSATVTAATRAR